MTDLIGECERCSKPFKYYRMTQKFCSPKCRQLACRLRNYDPSYHANWWKENKEKYKESRIAYEKEYRDKCPEKKLLNSVKNRAKKQGLPFDLDEEDIIIPKFCPVFKSKEMKRGQRYAPSIDRITPKLGYVKGNIQIISSLANRMKNDASPQELREFAEWIRTLET